MEVFLGCGGVGFIKVANPGCVAIVPSHNFPSSWQGKPQKIIVCHALEFKI